MCMLLYSVQCTCILRKGKMRPYNVHHTVVYILEEMSISCTMVLVHPQKSYTLFNTSLEILKS